MTTTTTNYLVPENRIEIIRGSTKNYELHVVDEEDEDVNLTGARVLMTVKCEETDTDQLIQKDSDDGVAEVDINKPLEGKALIKLGPSDTQTLDVGEYIFDVWVVLASGARHPVVLPSPFIVVAGVTVLT